MVGGTGFMTTKPALDSRPFLHGCDGAVRRRVFRSFLAPRGVDIEQASRGAPPAARSRRTEVNLGRTEREGDRLAVGAGQFAPNRPLQYERRPRQIHRRGSHPQASSCRPPVTAKQRPAQPEGIHGCLGAASMQMRKRGCGRPKIRLPQPVRREGQNCRDSPSNTPASCAPRCRSR